MVVGSSGAAVAIRDNQERITRSLESLTEDELLTSIQNAKRDYSKTKIKGLLAVLTLIGTGVFSYQTIKSRDPYYQAATGLLIASSAIYGIIQAGKSHFSGYTIDEGIRILEEKRNLSS